MRALLVYPEIPVTYWGFQHSLRIIGKPASLPPLGLCTLAALLPSEWELRLADLNVRRLSDGEIEWADVVLVGGMLIQAPAMAKVIRRARAAGRRVVVGGPAAATAPELFAEANIVFQGEAEGRTGELVRAITHAPARGPALMPPASYPPMDAVPAPRFDLLDVASYASMSLQYSRGCPYSCEFCDVIEIFGRSPRAKSAPQVLAELDALHATGYRGSLFLVDDNFIGNQRAVRDLLPALAAWQEQHGRPFELYTEASVDLAAEPRLTAAMVEAGFSAVFVGIETPSKAALAAAGKRQNLRIDPAEAIARLTRAGLEVMGGFIVGFDSDERDIFAAQAALIRPAPMPLAMVGTLNALPGTRLWRRLAGEGRLRAVPTGDQFGRPNFVPAMDEQELLSGYAGLLAEIYSPEEYYRRCAALLGEVGGTYASRGRLRTDLADFLRAIVRVGILSPRRPYFWRLLRRGLRRGLAGLRRAVVLGVKGEHMIRYTTEQVLPRLRAAAAAARDAASRQPGARAVAG